MLREAGLTPAGAPLYGQWSQRWGRHACELLIDRHPQVDAIFCGSDRIATGVSETLLRLGRTASEDVTVVGYDNWELFAAECSPPLSTVDLDLEQLGATAVGHLLAALDGRKASGTLRRPGRLVVRESTGRAQQRFV